MNSKTLWNDNWYFAKTALGVNWEDRQIWEAKMQPVDLPHDWLIYDTKNLYEDSIGWYRKNFAYAPVAQGAEAGTAYVLLSGKIVGRVPLVYGETVEQLPPAKRSPWQRLFGK